jgi:hypothetical protein
MKKRRHWRVWIWLLLTIITVGIGIILFLVNPWVNQFLQKKLNSTINNRFLVSTQSVFANVFKGDLKLIGLKLLQIEPKTEGDTLKTLAVDLEQLEIKNVRILSLLLSKNIQCDSITIVNPNISIYPKRKETAPKDGIGKKLGSIKLKNFRVTGGNLKQFEPKSKKPTIEVSNIRFELKDFKLPKDSVPNLINIRFSSIELASSGVTITSKKSLYSFSLDSILVSTASNFGYIKGFELNPKHSKYNFAQVFGRQTTRIDCKLSEVFIKKFNLNSLLVSDSLLVENVIVKGFSLDLFKDSRVPRPENMPEIPLPQELIRKLKFPIKIDTIDFRAGRINYEGRMPGSSQSGNIYISQANMSILNTSNITNSKGYIRDMRLGFNGLLMGEGRMVAQFSIPLANTNNPMTYSGELQKMDLRKFNPFLEPSVYMRIKSGQLNKLSFNVTAFSDTAVGKLSADYRGLNVSIQKINNKALTENSNLEWVVNLLINSFLIKKDNPTRKKDLRVATIYYERDKTRPVIHYWLQSLLTAVPESIGIPPRIRKKHLNKKTEKQQ